VERLLDSLNYPRGETLEKNRWIRAYKDMLGMTVEWKWGAETWNTSVQKLTATLATGDLTDLSQCEQETLIELQNGNKIEDLTDYYPWIGEYAKKSVECSPVTLDCASNNGRLYAFPSPSFVEPMVVWLRSDWLRKLRLSVPKNVADLV
jgi:putative aldouronate transport system substrate-binding protein